MSRLSVLSRVGAPAMLLAAAAVAAPSALAADTTPPSLAVSVGSGALGVGLIYNAGSSTAWGSGSTHWTVAGPNIGARSNEAGSISFTWRDGVTGRLRNRLTVPAGAGAQVAMPVGDDARGSLIPVTRFDTSTVTGVKHRLPLFSLQRFDVQAIDAAGNKSPVRSVAAVVGPDINLPAPY